ncbi:MAG: mechanosensitive ion channel family protein [Salinarimonas sp.]
MMTGLARLSSVPVSTWRIAVAAAMLVGILVATAPALAQPSAPADWSGTWETRWRDGGARLLLEQDGAAVTGVYPLFDGRIEAVAAGRELRGRWIEDGREGSFVFVQSRDGASFAGRFSSGEWWTGARDAAGPVRLLAVDQTSPMATMRSFLAAANRAAAGSPDALGSAVDLVRPVEEIATAADRFTYARALFAVLDETTLRLWDIPHAPEDGGDELTVEVEQAGTGESVRVAFLRENGLWYLAPPSLDRLEAMLERLRTARGDVMPGAHGSPRATMRSFLLGFRHGPAGSDPATREALDLRGRPELTRAHDAEVLAGYLKRVIDRTGYVIWQEIPDDSGSRTPYVHLEHPRGNVVIAPVETADGITWRFTADTLSTIRQVYAAIEDMPIAAGLEALEDRELRFAIRRLLRTAFPTALDPLGPMERWQWAALGATMLATVGAAQLAAHARWPRMPRPGTGSVRAVARSGPLRWALRSLAAGLMLLAASWVLDMPDRFSSAVATTGIVCLALGVLIAGWRMIGALAERYRQAERITGHNLILLSLVAGVLRVMLLIGAVLVVASALSLPVTGVLAGFGIGGIAFALAAQPTLQNLLSGFTIYADRPISVGDFCRFGDKMGTVEQIGLRSTRLRTLDRTLISVPNSQFLDMQLENFAQRDRFLLATMLQLRYETTPDQMRYILAELRKLLIAHPKVLPDPLRVRLAGFGAHALEVEVFSYVTASAIDEFASIREDILLRMMEAVSAAGGQFAFPSVTHYTAQDAAPDAERVGHAEAAVEEWRRTATLPFPDFDWREKAQLSGSLDFPPAGSVQGGPDGR